MEHTIRVLGVAPYEGLKNLMAAVAAKYPQVELTTVVGDLKEGVEMAKSNFHGNYDVVVSRGGTAQLLRQHLTLPVVEIEISTYDVLCALKLADGMTEKTALVSFSNITGNAKLLCDLLDYQVDIFTVDDLDLVEPTLRQMQNEKYHAILCDMVANTTAKRLGMNSFLINSGPESVRKAFEQVLLLSRSQKHLRDENLFFREVIQGQLSQTVVFDDEGHLFLSTLEEPKPELLALLRRELVEARMEQERRITRMLGGMILVIRSKRIISGSLSYVAFFFSARKTPLPSSQAGIRFFSRKEAEDAYYSGVFSFAGSLSDDQIDIERISRSAEPVVITGEDGTGKEAVANLLYMRGPLQNSTLVSINCNLLTDKSWGFLMEHHNSPLYEEGNTLYFSSIDVLSTERRTQLLAILSEMDVCRRNRILFSSTCQQGEHTSAVGAQFMDALCCLSLSLPPLRSMPARLPSLVNLSLSHLNADMSRQILRVEPEAMSILQTFQWPHNYTQFRRVIGELTVVAEGQVITADAVRQTLRKERHVGAVSPRAENSAVPLDLSRTLDEINQDVIRRVLEESGGNQTAAAKRLGISRTTLWRLLQK